MPSISSFSSDTCSSSICLHFKSSCCTEDCVTDEMGYVLSDDNRVCVVICKHTAEPVNSGRLQSKWHNTVLAHNFELLCQKSI